MIRRGERDSGAVRAPSPTLRRSRGRGRWGWRLWRDRRGAVIVEFAMLAPIMLLVLIGIIIFGLTLSQYATLWSGAAASAEQFALGGSKTPATLAWNALTGAAPPPTFAANVSCSTGLCLTLYVNGTACATEVNSLTAAGKADSTCYQLFQANSNGLVPAQAVATYPCALTVLQYNFYPNCQLTAQVTELVPQ